MADKLLSEQKESARTLKRLRGRVLEQEAQELIRDSEGPVLLVRFEERTAHEVRQLALEIIRNPGHVVLFGLQSGERAQVVLARSRDVDLDMRDLIPVISPLLNARGGGRESLVELAGDRPEALTQALDTARQHLNL